MVSLPWQPQVSDVAWMATLLSSVKEGGIWGIPDTGQVYTVNHAKKTLTLILDPGTPKSAELHEKNCAILVKLGWTAKTDL